MKIYDISLSLNNQTIIYPGNPEINIEPHRSVPEFPTNLSKITFGSHTGTHIDAPRHVDNDSIGADKINLEACIGPCRVLDMTAARESIKVSDLERESVRAGERILVKTKNSLRGFKDFYDDYIYLDGDAADYLADIGIILFGIDSLSIKKRGGLDTRPHTSFLKKNIVLFEGLDLSKIEPGEYQFIGLPLKFTDLDGAPARAILIKKAPIVGARN
jgi:arylformamidase